ncbi:MAG TPA: peptide MFS transporter [Pirellulaceae bacterium]|nr:peptide MFS transporter [Pirellulaceae bacterium]HMP71120.1 peptide MFS transporter [Pirellulaceae bacterium]
MKDHQLLTEQPTLFGHPTGLFTLFFAELWERVSYYGMRALLVFYMIKGFMGYSDGNAYKIYGAYTALVYMTPFFGGMIADRLIGYRRAVILGGLFMAAGHLMMTVENKTAFYAALALLIVGNGFFKPNISTMVGSLYPQGSPKRDGGFTIFYIGINLGAAIAPLMCGYIGETYGWHKGFGLATVGMLTGLAVFIAPTLLSQLLLLVACIAATLNIVGLQQLSSINPYLNYVVAAAMVLAGLIAFVSLNQRQSIGELKNNRLSDMMTILLVLLGAIGFAVAMFMYHPNEFWTKMVFYALAVVLIVAAIISSIAIAKSGLPSWAGLPADFQFMRSKTYGIPKDWLVYLCALLSVPVFMMLVSGFEPITKVAGGISIIPKQFVENLEESDSAPIRVLGTFVHEASTPAGLVLIVAGIFAVGYLFAQMFRLSTIPRHRMYVAMILIFFSMLFWSFFEQAGSSVNNFTDRNVSRVAGVDRSITAADVGNTVRLRIPLESPDASLANLPVLTQEFLGRSNAHPGMQAVLTRAIREIERVKIEERRKGVNYDKSLDQETDELVARVWNEFKPADEGRATNGEIANPENVDSAAPKKKTRQEKEAEQEQEKEKAERLKNRVTELVQASNLVKSSAPKLDIVVNRIIDRIKVEDTIAKLQKSNQLTMTGLTYLREFASSEILDIPVESKQLEWTFAEDNVGIGLGGNEIPASIFQAVNPAFILIFGLVFTVLWSVMSSRGIEPSTPIKFALGLIQLAMGFACFWIGAASADSNGFVWLPWLVMGYLFQTTGELCLSPVGLSMVTKLSPKRLVSTVMGTWFLAIAFSQFLAAIIAQFSSVKDEDGGSVIPIPAETVNIYGELFRFIAIAACISGVFCLLLAPILTRWMHMDQPADND